MSVPVGLRTLASSRLRGGHAMYTTMTWTYCRSTGRLIRQLMPNFYRPDFDPNEALS